MKKFLSLLLALTFVFGTMPLSAVANTLEYTEKVTLTPAYYDKNGENENAEKYSVYGIYSESLFESDRLSDLTRYLEATPDEKTIFVITDGALSHGYENVRILMYILGLHDNCVLVSYGNGAHNSVAYKGDSISYADGEYVLDFTYVTLEDGESGFDVLFDEHGVELLLPECKHNLNVNGHVHMNEEGAETTSPCAHEWSDWQTVNDSTCEAEGTKQRTCSVCGETEEDVIEKKEHSYESSVIAPTCIADGYTLHKCKDCGEEYKDSYVSSTGTEHKYESSVTAPTCTEKGYTTYVCEYCSYTYTDDETSALGHGWGALQSDASGHWSDCSVCGEHSEKSSHNYVNGICTECNYECTHSWGDWTIVQDSTCTETGSKKRTCSVCNETEEETIGKKDHNYTGTVTEPTCTEGGYTTYVCDVCGDSYKDDETPETGHDWSQWEYDSEGHSKKCSVCGAKDEKTAHDTTSGSCICGYDPVAECTHENAYLANKKDPTCTEDGYTGDTYCPDCNSTLVYGTTDPKKGHSWSDWQTVTDSTCTTEGTKQRTCSVCNETEEDVIEKKEHNYKGTVTEPTCTEGGYTTYVCDVCGNGYKDDETPETGHDWSQWDYDSEGHSKKCSVCGTKDEKTAHDTTSGSCICGYDPVAECTHENAYLVNQKAPTCTEDGYTGDTYCPDCNSTLVYGTTDPKKGHSYEPTVTPPTCEEKGYTTYVCDVCGDSYKADETPAAGHSWSDWQTVNDSTCEAEGTKQRTCSVCGETEEDVIEKKEHSYESSVIAPTCIADGYTLHKCKDCGEEYKDSYVSSTGTEHKYGSSVTAPTCTEKGYTTYVCEYCSDAYTGDETSALGHSWGAPQSDPNAHWSDCSVCGEHSEKSPHNYVDSVCTECNYECTHNWEWQTVTESTCEESGLEEKTCLSCGKKETEVTDPKGHSYTDTVVPPTCTEDGYTRHECDCCGHSYNDTFVKTDGHEWNAWVTTVEPTCTEKGSKKRICEKCAESETEEIAENGHSYVDTVIPPTCEEKGYTTHTCSVCSDTYDDSYTDALGHKWDLWVTDDFTHAKQCSVCSETDESAQHTYTDSVCSECLHACGHSETEDKEAFDATCTSQGYTGNTYCTACGKLIGVGTTIPEKGHTWSDWQQTADTHHKYCTVCDVTDSEGEHTYNESGICTVCGYGCAHPNKKIENALSATCTSEGYTGDEYCLDCGVMVHGGTTIPMEEHAFGSYVYTDVSGHFKKCANCTATTEIEAHQYTNGRCTVCRYRCTHEWGDWQIITDSTCTQTGTQKHVCNICAYEVSETIPEKGHDYKHTVTPPTCTEKGYTTHDCSRCDEADYVDTYVNENGHSWGNWIIVNDSTCTEKGTKKQVCSVCFIEQTAEIEAKGHNYKPTVTEPTCTEKGFTTYTCERCGNSYVDDYVDALGHSYGEWVITVSPTFSKDGEMKHTCSRCAKVETQVIPKNEDNTPPVATIIADNGKTWDSFDTSIEFDTFYNKFIAVSITAKDIGTSSKDTSGILSIEYYTSGNIYTIDQLKNINGWKSIQNVNTGGSFVLSAEGTYVVYVRVTDKVGNAAYFSSSGIVIDRTAPKITADGIDDNTTNFTSCGAVSITATDNYLSKVYINGLEHQFTGKSFTITLDPDETKYEILIVDAAGNTRELTVFVNGEHVAGDAATCTEAQKCTVCGAVMKEALGHRWGAWTVTKSATAKENGEEMRQCRRCTATETRQTPKLDFPTEFTSKTYTYSAAEGIIDGVKGNTTIEQFLSNMDNSEYIKIFGIDTKEITDKNTLIATGMKIKLMENDTSYSAEATVIIRGDVNGDGIIDTADAIQSRSAFLEKITLVAARLEAADYNDDGIVDTADTILITFKYLGKEV